MVITDYTSYAEVRTTVGLSVDELPDTVLAAELYQNVLQLALRKITLQTGAPGTGLLDERFLTIEAKLEAARTPEEQELYALTRLFSTYVVAHQVAVSLSTRTPKMESDGKRTLTRFSPESVYQTTAANIDKLMQDIKVKIETLSATEFVMPSLIRVVTPATDVVTNS